MATEVATHPSQRQAKIAAAAAAFPIATSPPKSAAHETLIAAMYREIVRIDNWLNDPINQTDEKGWQAQTDYLSQLMNAIVDLPSQGPMDFIYKMMGHTANGEHCLCCGPSEMKVWADAYALIEGSTHIQPPSAEDPVLPLFREWIAARQTWYCYAAIPSKSGKDPWDEPKTKAAERRENAALNALLKTTPRSMAGIAAFAAVLWDIIGPAVRDEEDFLEQGAWPANKLILEIWRAASGRDDFPPNGKMEGVL